MISALTDMRKVIDDRPSLLLQKVKEVCVMGGIEQNEDGKWVPDTAQNNKYDQESAAIVYTFCLEEQIPLRVISRDAVPGLRMTLAKEFAVQGHPLMKYL